MIAGLTLVAHQNSAMSVSRGKRHIASQEHSHLFLCRQSRGTLISEQEGREAVLQPGDMVLIDPKVPFSARFSSETKFLIVMLPRRELDARVGNTKGLISRALKPHVGVNGLTSCFLEALSSQTEGFDPAIDEIVRSQFLELAALSLSLDTGAIPQASSAKALALFRIRAAIERNLADPSLNGWHVAAQRCWPSRRSQPEKTKSNNASAAFSITSQSIAVVGLDCVPKIGKILPLNEGSSCSN